MRAALPLFAIAALIGAAMVVDAPARIQAATARCSVAPGETLALLRVERDTTLPFVPFRASPMSMSGVAPSAADSMLATPGTPMPAARVRLLRIDSTTRAALAAHGVVDRQPTAFIRAAPYRADCRTVRWSGPEPFVRVGELGFVRATLAPRERWVGSVPVLVIHEVGSYPYPLRRGLAYQASPDEPLAPADAVFSFSLATEMPEPRSAEEATAHLDAARARATSWARANPAVSELEPIRTLLREAVLRADWWTASRVSSRLRGTYRVELEAAGERHSWYFRTHDRPAYSWREADSSRTSADLLASPHISGYQLLGYAGSSPDPPPVAPSTLSLLSPLVWLATDDRPTAPGNAARPQLTGVLEFRLTAVPEPLWPHLEALVAPPTPVDSAWRARNPLPRGSQQPRVPLTFRLDERGRVRADTTLIVAGRQLRVLLERVDTLSVTRPF